MAKSFYELSIRDRHKRMYVVMPRPQTCPECSSISHIELHNLDGRYDDNPSNWKYLCRKCHMKKDGRSDMLRNFGFIRSTNPVMNMVECACGCGGTRPELDQNGKKVRYIFGHSRAGQFKHGQRPWNYGLQYNIIKFR